jgi:hypothetical protein
MAELDGAHVSPVEGFGCGAQGESLGLPCRHFARDSVVSGR